MAITIIRANKDEDLYLTWSTETDSPLFVGTRAELVEHLDTAPVWRFLQEPADDIIGRADRNGSADRNIGFGHWDDEYLGVGAAGPCDGSWYQLHRTDLADFARAFQQGDTAAQHALLECWHRPGDPE